MKNGQLDLMLIAPIGGPCVCNSTPTPINNVINTNPMAVASVPDYAGMFKRMRFLPGGLGTKRQYNTITNQPNTDWVLTAVKPSWVRRNIVLPTPVYHNDAINNMG